MSTSVRVLQREGMSNFENGFILRPLSSALSVHLIYFFLEHPHVHLAVLWTKKCFIVKKMELLVSKAKRWTDAQCQTYSTKQERSNLFSHVER